MITRRITFNLNQFLQDLNTALEDKTGLIDDEVQRYKEFLSRTKEPLLSDVQRYVNNHPLVTGNQRLKSFIMACHVISF